MARLRASEVQEHFSNDYTEQDRNLEMDLEDLGYDHDQFLALQEKYPMELGYEEDHLHCDDWFPNLWMDHGQM